MKSDHTESNPLAIEDYALLSDCRTGALVGNNGSIDWLCWPRFDSDACFAGLVGTPRHGHWMLAPVCATASASRSYHPETMVLETVYETPEGCASVTDYMPIGEDHSSVVRVAKGVRGRVAMRMQLIARFDYGATTPWITRHDDHCGVTAIAGPNCVTLFSDVRIHVDDRTVHTTFITAEGESQGFSLSYSASHAPPPVPVDVDAALARTEFYWRTWVARCTYRGEWRAIVVRSLLTLKALTFHETGGIAAALTTSLPEHLGGERNWDYRYCWLRDATLTLAVLVGCGYDEEAAAWQAWLQRCLGGDPTELQIMYGLGGERRLPEWSPSWLPGYQGSKPVRVGNAAGGQLQIDVYGEIVGALFVARKEGIPTSASSWRQGIEFLGHLEKIWMHADESIWEVRSGPQQFTYSKVMAWVAFDRTVRAATQDIASFDSPETLTRWRRVRDRIHAETCQHGFNTSRGSFTQVYGGTEVDAALLLLPLTGFLPIDDPRVMGTVRAIEDDLLVDGFVRRYRTANASDGLPPGEGAFIPCSFWLAHVYALQGRQKEARKLFKRLIDLCNDVGLLSEEYSPQLRRQLGNFPQAFSHLSLISTALHL